MSDEIPTSDQVRSKRVELIIRQLDTLPTLPVVAGRLLQATASKDTARKEIVSLIESDQSLTAKVLAMTRRAYLGIRGPVTTVDRAVSLMGLDAVRHAVLSIQVFEAFGPKDRAEGEGRSFDRVEFWKHSLAVACAAQLITEKLPGTALNADEVFVCGLLHDLGKVVLDASLPKSFERVVKMTEASRTSIAEVERRVFGLDHAAIGKKLAEQWQLPAPIVHAIWLSHHKSSALPESIKHRDLIDVIYLADLIAREQQIGFSGNFIFADRSSVVAGELGISAEDYGEILTDLRKRMGERAKLIGLDQVSTEDLYQQALRLANVELGKVNQSLAEANRTLESRARYSDALNELNCRLKGDLTTMDTLEHVAAAVRLGLNLPAVVVYRQDDEKGFLETVFVNQDDVLTRLFETPKSEGEAPHDMGQPLLSEPPESLAPVIAHYGRRLGTAEIKTIRLESSTRRIGGVLFACEERVGDRLAREHQEVQSLITACGMTLDQAIALESKDNLADDLLAVNRRMRELEQRLLESRCLAALGELAGGAAHELNNPLAIISGRAQLLRDQEEDDEKRKTLNIIVEQTHEASDLVTEMMKFAKPLHPKREWVSLQESLNRLADDFAQRGGLSRDQITVDIGETATGAYCDPQHLTGAIDELLTNAVDAGQADELHITLATVADDDPGFVRISVTDNGPGMAPDVLNKAMDLFFSSRKAGRKKGLGLGRAYRYVQANEGMLWLESQVGTGTTAYLRLPAELPPDTPGKDS